MSKLSEKNHLDYFILFVLLCALEIVLVIYTIMHPRPQNIVLVLIDGLLIFLNRKWMNKAEYVSPSDYDKDVKAWEKRKREVQKSGKTFDEPKPEKPKKMAQRLLPMFIATLFAGYFAYFLASMLTIAFPAHMPYEYKWDIAKLKEVDTEAYSFFPDQIPDDAKNVKWYVMPSFMQGSGTEVLIFDASDSYIQGVTNTYGSDAEICGIEDDMLFKRFYDEARWDKLTVYKIYDNDDWNHVHMWGFFVDDEIDRIGFFSE